MLFLKIFINILVLLFGICYIIGAKRDIERKWYSIWICIGEIIAGVLLILWSFSIWFFV